MGIGGSEEPLEYLCVSEEIKGQWLNTLVTLRVHLNLDINSLNENIFVNMRF